MTRSRLRPQLAAFSVFICSILLISSAAWAVPGDRSSDGVWTQIAEPAHLKAVGGPDFAAPSSFGTFRVEAAALDGILARIPHEREGLARGVVLSLPMPDGGFASFRVVESPILSDELQARHPEIRTYLGKGIDDPAASVRFDMTMFGLRAMILSPRGTVFIDPYSRTSIGTVISYRLSDLPWSSFSMSCGVEAVAEDIGESSLGKAIPLSGDELHTYRMAVNGTGEYTQFFGSVAAAEASIVTTMNRVTQIYENDIAVRFNLVYTNAYPDPATDPFTTGGTVNTTLLQQNTSAINSSFGSANYDIGHVFTRVGSGSSGLAYLRAACNFSLKGGGASGAGIPQGDVYAVGLVAHEVGHQMGAAHTFNTGIPDNCGNNRSSADAYEPGSGSTIMSYGGICAGANVVGTAQPNFHHNSLEEMINHRNGSGSCASTTATGNTPPVASGGPDYTIPTDTPFVLTGSAVDPDPDTLTYSWEQHDLGAATPPTDYLLGPLFRALDPIESSTRYFPDLGNLLIGLTSQWELLPTVDRVLRFRLVARDNALPAGGVDDDHVQIVVAGSPFFVTYPNGFETLTGGEDLSITWTVGGGAFASDVSILYSEDAGATFSTIVASTPNDGEHTITLPCTETTEARIWVQPVGEIFFDVSDRNFSITTQAPVASGTTSLSADQPSCTFTVNVPVSVSDDKPVAELVYGFSSQIISGAGTIQSEGFNILPQSEFSALFLGQVVVDGVTESPAQLEVTMTAEDDCANVVTQVYVVDLIDTELPGVTCPPNISVEATSEAGIDKNDPELAAFFAAPVATDNCSTPVITDDAPATLPVGDTTVTFTATDGGGNTRPCSALVTVTPPTSTTPDRVIARTGLRSIHPNPFNPSTTVSFALRSDQDVRLDVYNQRGQHVATLFDGQLAQGVHEVPWDGRDAAGQPVGSGVYLVKLVTPEVTESRRMALVK